jgi:hypothetical protein
MTTARDRLGSPAPKTLPHRYDDDVICIDFQ